MGWPVSCPNRGPARFLLLLLTRLQTWPLCFPCFIIGHSSTASRMAIMSHHLDDLEKSPETERHRPGPYL
ncbi:uncharacterized protein THITE_2117108 [Thermothielavioides terrestris NRRL 8126]|uniref:Uncharacterized protein n=1 Tax=Thermothielavioides terrestris (strain ATCC 38088 / NRRL 8126) TaxID=578455 RepID=G2R7M2_THETT|nr:uncharacterized protein THITE_2117108 [Thermothielavioides terrestris NRRL 8126]AEO67931.1 hypothetical protein THITE_2117108 [Thermothielavioides terrestris NRRL 8126]